MSNARGLVRPDNCAIGFALPFSKESFRLQAANLVPTTFVNEWLCGTSFESLDHAWDSYSAYAALAMDVCVEAAGFGVLVNAPSTLKEWSKLFRSRSVVCLVAHLACNAPGDERIEFADGLYGIREIGEFIPKAFAGILHLVMCNSSPVALGIKQAHPDCTVIFDELGSSLDYRIAMQRQVFRLLDTGTYAYPAAVTTVYQAVTKESAMQVL